VLIRVPRRADAQVHAPARDVIDRRRHLRQHRRVAIRHPGHDDSTAQPRRVGGHRRQERQALEAGAGGIRLDRQEVVEHRRPVELDLLGQPPQRQVLVERGVLLTSVDAKAELSVLNLHPNSLGLPAFDRGRPLLIGLGRSASRIFSMRTQNRRDR
jgi:hypothetical protein